jgi:hypothetical protein
VFLECGTQIAAAIAFASERIIAAYKSLLEIRKLREDLVAQGLKKNELAGIDKHAADKMESSIREIVGEVMRKYEKDHEKGRAHELSNALSISLTKLANRIDRGFHLEIRSAPPDKNSERNLSEEELRGAQELQDIGRKLDFIRPSGKPFLSLQEKEPHRPKKLKDDQSE